MSNDREDLSPSEEEYEGPGILDLTPARPTGRSTRPLNDAWTRGWREVPIAVGDGIDVPAERALVLVGYDRCQCGWCGQKVCHHCGKCHQPGCWGARVVCEQAQAALVTRRRIPTDQPPVRKKFLGLF